MSRFKHVGLPGLLKHCHFSLVNVVDILKLKFESVVNIGKTGEEDCSIVPREYCDSTELFTQTIYVRPLMIEDTPTAERFPPSLFVPFSMESGEVAPPMSMIGN
ncbi:hypothetical protein AVEN_6780-1 [Araneus ventricosus]|uniref:Uncharacterized protein n=1 Tax=Araneus ventricosus TaxID=182803 RepID=A0A4Y2LXU0_ARAVE|nr:hypothetical protein AVEN_6780-1 [Araneus ventricosus]